MANKKKGPHGGAVGINIGLSDKSRTAITAILDVLLPDEVLLYIKTRNFHWNVVSPSFSEMHKFFEEQYEALDEIFDDVAERIRALGGRAPGSMADLSSSRDCPRPAEKSLGRPRWYGPFWTTTKR